jgi:hypothetical protein
MGVNHPGFKLASGEKLLALESQLKRVDAARRTEANTACCYARSNKCRVIDPQGISRETLRAFGTAPVLGELLVAGRVPCCALALWPTANTVVGIRHPDCAPAV